VPIEGCVASMTDPLFALFDEFAVRRARGEHPDVREYLERAGDRSDELADLIDRFLQTAGAVAPDDATIALMEAWIHDRAPLIELRVARGVRVGDATEALAEELAIEQVRWSRLRRYYQRLEQGALDPSRVDQRVFAALGRLLNISAEELRAWLVAQPRAQGQAEAAPVPAYLREASSESVTAPAREEDEWDELDEVFLGTREAP
jgi:hypothetical protein